MYKLDEKSLGECFAGKLASATVFNEITLQHEFRHASEHRSLNTFPEKTAQNLLS